MASQRKRFQVQFEVAGDGKVSAAFVDVEQGARKAGDAVEKGGKQAGEAADRHDRLVRAAQEAGKVLGTAVVAGALAAGTATAKWTRQVVESARDVERFAQLANTTPEVFQRWAAASATVNIEQEKLADILKDMQDRVGDFLQTGGGPMADFFEQIAPRVGVTAEQFARLSGPDALLLYVDSLQRANLHQNDLAFYMEALASDSTMLLPLLQDNGRALRELGDEAAAAGAIMDEDMIAATLELDERMRKWSLTLTGLRQEIVQGLIPELNNLMDTMNDPEMRSGLVELAEAFATATGWAIKAAGGIGQAIAKYKEWLSLRGMLPTDAGSSDEQLSARRAALVSRVENIENSGNRTVWGPEELAELRRQIDEIDQMMVDRMVGAARQAAADLVDAENARNAEADYDNRFRGLPADYGLDFHPGVGRKPPGGSGAGAGSAGRTALTEADRAARELDRAYEALNTRLLEQVSLFGQTGEAARVRYEIEHGALQDLDRDRQIELQRQAALLDVLGMAEEAEQIAAENAASLAESAQDAFGSISLAAEQAGRNIQGHLADFLFDPFEDGLDGMVENFARALQRMAAEMAASELLDALGGWGSSNAGEDGWQGALGGMLAGLFGGGRAVGGPTHAGGIYRVNEHEPELLRSGGQTYLLMGGQDGHVVPPRAAAGGGGAPQVNVTVHEAPPGTQVGTRPNASGGVDVEILVGQLEGHLATRYAGGEGPLHTAIKNRHNLRDSS